MGQDKKIIAALDLDVEGLIRASEKAREGIKSITEELKKLKEEGKENTATFKKLEEQLKSVLGAADSLKESVSNLKDASKDLYFAQDKLNDTLEDTAALNELLSGAMGEAADAVEEISENAVGAQKELTGLGIALTAANKGAGGLAESSDKAAVAVTAMGEAAPDTKTAVEGLNDALKTNKGLTKDSAGSADTGKKSFADFSKQFKDSFDSINVLNTGFSGLIENADKAGGAGPLVKNAFNGMAEGIGGMTKSALTFIATPVGAVIAALAIAVKAVSYYFTDTQEGIDKLNAITVPLKEVMGALMGIFSKLGKVLVDTFSDPQKAIEDFATMLKDNIVNRFWGLLELIPNLGKAVGMLFKGDFAGAAKVAADAAGKVGLGVENITDKVANAAKKTGEFFEHTSAAAKEAWERGQKMAALQKNLDKGLADYTKTNGSLGIELDKQKGIADDTNKTFAQRQAAAVAAVDIQKQQNKLVLERLDDEIALFKLKSKGKDAELAELAEMEARRNETAAQQTANEEGLQTKLTGIRQQAMDAAIKKQHELLDLFVAQNPAQEKTLKERLAFEEQYASKSMALLKKELDAQKISRAQYEKEVLSLKENTAAKMASAAADNAQAELNLWLQQNKSYTAGAKELTENLVNQEAERIKEISDKNISLLELKNGLNRQAILDKQASNEALTQKETEFLTQLLQLQEDYKTQKAANDKLWEDAKIAQDNKKITDRAAKRTQDAADLDADYQKKIELADGQYEQERLKEELRYKQELAVLDQRRIDEQMSDETFNKLKEAAKIKHSDNEKKIDQSVIDNKLSIAQGWLSSLSAILGKESAAGKAVAVAQATIDTYKSAVSAYAAGMALGGPVGLVMGPLAAGMAVSAGIQNIKKITSTKAPKAEKGALFSIGGQRHSAGGTLFTGADGTQFEAEQGELIGVLNRNAARHFMAFNNAFPAGSGSAPNYFASGGIVSREVAQQGFNVDELAAKIAQANTTLPAPVVAVQDIITQGNSYVRVREGANF
jgi:hypothetical protein